MIECRLDISSPTIIRGGGNRIWSIDAVRVYMSGETTLLYGGWLPSPNQWCGLKHRHRGR